MEIVISVIIPCRNEEKYIEKCLNSLIEQDYSKDSLEILIVDGISEDKTREIVEKYTQQYSFVKLLNNPKKIIPAALNIGIKEAKGEIIIKIDAHSTYQKDYVSKCVKYLKEYKADNVGGVMKTLPSENTLWAKAIAISLSHFFGAGGSYFRTGVDKPKWVDTVFGGCYKKEVFKKIGFFNEKLTRSEDMEFNLRLKRAGGKILLVPDIVSYYYPKSTLKDFFIHNLKDGIWVTYPLKFGIKAFSWRHLVPLAFVVSLILSLFLSLFFWPARFIFYLILVSYILLALFFSTKIFIKKGFKYLLVMPIVFVARHMAYGLGSLFGLLKVLSSK